MATHGLREVRRLAAPPQRVWRALTDTSELAAWFWPAAFATSTEADVRPGGRYHLVSAVAGIGVGGEYQRVEPPELLQFSWQWDGEPAGTTVTFRLRPTGEGTELVVDHEGFATDADRESHVTGWRDCLDRLPGHLAAG